MRRQSLLFLFFALSCLIACDSEVKNEGSSVGQATASEQIRIGVLVSLTGAAAEQGQNWLKGVQLAEKELLSGGRQVKFWVEDDATNPGKATLAFSQLVQIRKVSAVIGGTWDFLAQAVSPIADRSKVYFLSPTNPKELLAEQGLESPWVLSNALSLDAEMAAMEDFLLKMKVRSVSLIYPNLAWGTTHADLIRRLAKKHDIQIKHDFDFPYEGYLDAVRVKTLEVLQDQPDLIYAPIDSSGIEAIVKEILRLKASVPLLVSQHLQTALEITNTPEYYTRVYGVYPEAMFNSAFSKAFQDFHGELPKVYAASGYDAAHFLSNFLVALRASPSKTSEMVKEDFRYEGIVGTYRFLSGSPEVVEHRATIMQGRSSRSMEIVDYSSTD